MEEVEMWNKVILEPFFLKKKFSAEVLMFSNCCCNLPLSHLEIFVLLSLKFMSRPNGSRVSSPAVLRGPAYKLKQHQCALHRTTEAVTSFLARATVCRHDNSNNCLWYVQIIKWENPCGRPNVWMRERQQESICVSLCGEVEGGGAGSSAALCSAVVQAFCACCHLPFFFLPFFSWASPAQQRKQSRLLLWPPQNGVKQKQQNGSSWGYQSGLKANVGCGNKWWSELLIRKYLYVWP